ncbi:SDR family NAD(P)-dependent oxidoreductase [Effusibacillus dendaii]|uniref:Beta-ketoacyl-ACP reductase n=1 Tax=Effusibacillus dendaii TaxID=2743772 RepID=A0A7I8DC90_9BACL|nr:SDR family oxidoreductase [Effusibacillus dendaii]BCJ86130.1 beta-ketoacyl-ACP reductase [Effusibacillus dendaii]
MKMLEGKVAIITGSGRGVGRATAELFAEHGAKVVVNDLDAGPAEETIAAIRAKGSEGVSVVGDVTAADFPKRAIAAAIDSFGRLDILVNNAGYTWDALIHKMTDEQFQKMLDVHLITPFRMIREASPYMRDAAKTEIEQGITNYRKIVNVTSVAAFGNVGQANYSSAKSGLIGLTKTVAKEWGPFNINTNAVAYGLVDTRLTQEKEKGETVQGVAVGIPSKVRKMFEQAIPQRRAGTPEEAASVILFLASPLSNYTNGQVVHMNGGSYT